MLTLNWNHHYFRSICFFWLISMSDPKIIKVLSETERWFLKNIILPTLVLGFVFTFLFHFKEVETCKEYCLDFGYQQHSYKLAQEGAMCTCNAGDSENNFLINF